MDLKQLKDKADKSANTNKKFFKSLKKSQLRDLDDQIHYLHQEVFQEVDCLECANCCRSLGPRITDRDIER
ncbi:MAG: YkgJ family cysteine cluster protein, partial [Bacteroidales bacterium]